MKRSGNYKNINKSSYMNILDIDKPLIVRYKKVNGKFIPIIKK